MACGRGASVETERLRRALIDDDPPGVRARAQGRARERERTASVFARDWWRFESTSLLDCVLISDGPLAAGSTEALAASLPAGARLLN